MHKTSGLIAYTKGHSLNIHMQLTSGSFSHRLDALNLGLSLHLWSYFVCIRHEGSDETVRMHRLVRAFHAARTHDKTTEVSLTGSFIE